MALMSVELNNDLANLFLLKTVRKNMPASVKEKQEKNWGNNSPFCSFFQSTN
jgi:hypothetical protein